MRKQDKGDEYIKKFPKFKKWINVCLCCNRKGYNPEIPDRISTFEGSLGSHFIKKYFEPLSVNENGLCEVCAKILNK